MPHRVGVVHVRDANGAAGKSGAGAATVAKVPVQIQFTSKDVNVATKAFHERLAPLLASRQRNQLDDREARRFGLHHTNAEVEVFLNANAQQLSADKWLCAVCSKKFVSSDFLKKHVQRRNPERLEQIAAECKFFNAGGARRWQLAAQVSPPAPDSYRPRAWGPYDYRQQGFRGGGPQCYRQPGTPYQ